MIGAVYRPGSSPLHRLPAGWKLGGLTLFAALAALLPGLAAAMACCGLAIAALASTKPSLAGLRRDLGWPLAVIGLVALAAFFGEGIVAAATTATRLAALLAAAQAVSVSTPAQDLLDAFEAGLSPLGRLGIVDPAKAALTVSLAIRCVPLIAEEARTVRRAQASRGLGANPVALAVPLVVRCLRRADALAAALEARGWPPDTPAIRSRDPRAGSAHAP